jgi:hypothetical protein
MEPVVRFVEVLRGDLDRRAAADGEVGAEEEVATRGRGRRSEEPVFVGFRDCDVATVGRVDAPDFAVEAGRRAVVLGEATEQGSQNAVVLVARVLRELFVGFADGRNVEGDEVLRTFGAARRDDAFDDVVEGVRAWVRGAESEENLRESRPTSALFFGRAAAFCVSSKSSASAAVANERR